ncbi:MAG: YgfZ/GcvT domain-containing protein [Candidatus Puniceispirillales bacterium]
MKNDMTDEQMTIWHLNGRSSLSVTGQDAEAFLNDVLTLDITTLPADSVTPAVLLTPQGRIIFDLLISRITDGFRLECDQNRIDDLMKKLRLYRLRRAVGLMPLDEPVFAMLTEPHDTGWMKDSRFQDITACRYYGTTTPDNQAKIVEDDTAYRAMRYQYAIPEGSIELPTEKALPLEAGLDRLGAISFDKGCFIGQEVTARTRYRGLLKRRYVPIRAMTDITVPTDIHADERLAGELLGLARAGDSWIGLANIRLDALDQGQRLMAGTNEIIPLTGMESTTKA